MVELEILFSSGQGIVLIMDDRESALMFMKKAMDTDLDDELGLCHFSTQHEELLIDISDISFVRLKKEGYPLLGTGLKIAERSSFKRNETPASSKESKPKKDKKKKKEKRKTSSSSEPIEMGPSQATETPFSKAEKHLSELEKQKSKLEASLKANEEKQKKLDDAHHEHLREAELKRKLENIEISKEIKDMKKDQNP